MGREGRGALKEEKPTLKIPFLTTCCFSDFVARSRYKDRWVFSYLSFPKMDIPRVMNKRWS
jgi:hypothetical protein